QVECKQGVLYRWVGEDAGFTVEAPEGCAQSEKGDGPLEDRGTVPFFGSVLSLDMQVGPGVDQQPFKLQVLDADGQIVAQGSVADRKVVHLLLPLRSGQSNRFRLHTPEGGKRTSPDPRILNFAVFRCFWSED